MNDWKGGELIYRNKDESRYDFVQRVKNDCLELETDHGWETCYRWFGDAATIFVFCDPLGNPVVLGEEPSADVLPDGWYRDPFARYPKRYFRAGAWTHYVTIDNKNTLIDPKGSGPDE